MTRLPAPPMGFWLRMGLVAVFVLVAWITKGL